MRAQRPRRRGAAYHGALNLPFWSVLDFLQPILSEGLHREYVGGIMRWLNAAISRPVGIYTAQLVTNMYW